MILASARECWQLIPLHSVILRVGFLLLMVAAVWACGPLLSYWLIVGLIAWVLIDIAIITFPASQHYWGHPALIAFLCLLLIPLFGQSLIGAYYLQNGKFLILYILLLVWSADIGAYGAGKILGTHKMIPRVSPGKSWEGALGGFILALLIAVGAGCYVQPKSWCFWLILAAATTLSSIFGDLFISMLKRRCNLKDTGALIPGHGGILDRLDSLIAAAPVFYFGLSTSF